MKRNMTASYEIIRVVDPSFLVNSAKQACRYEMSDGQQLAPGYYFALWPAEVAVKTFDPAVRYFGPFPTQQEVELIQECAVFLGIVAAPSCPQPGRDRNDSFLTPAVRSAYVALMQAAQTNRRSHERVAARRRHPGRARTESAQHIGDAP